MKELHEIVNAHAAVADQEIRYKHLMSPEQKAFMQGCRSALAWALGLAKGGRKVEQMLQKIPVFATVDPKVGTKTMEELGVKLE